MGAIASCIRLRRAKRYITRDAYLVMPTIELRSFVARLNSVEAIPPQELARFLADVPYETDYSVVDGYVDTAGLTFRRAPSRLSGGMSLDSHIKLGELGFDCHLVLPKYAALKLLHFETRAGLTGETPSLTELARRLAPAQKTDARR